jgi:hypothetical protein
VPDQTFYGRCVLLHEGCHHNGIILGPLAPAAETKRTVAILSALSDARTHRARGAALNACTVDCHNLEIPGARTEVANHI